MKHIFTLLFITTFSFVNAQVKEERDLGTFSAITASSVAEIILMQSDTSKVVVDAPEHQMSNVITKISGNNLEVSIKGTWENEKAVIYVYTPNINYIECSGAAIIKTDGVFKTESLTINSSGASVLTLYLNLTELHIHSSGAAVLKLYGFADKAYIKSSGASILKANDLTISSAKISLSGASKSSINATQEIRGTATGVAAVEVFGNPFVNEINNSSVSSGDVPSIEDVEINNDIVGDIKYKETIDSTYVSVGNKKVIIVEDIDKTRVDVQLKDTTKKKEISMLASIDVGMNGYLTSSQGISLPASQNLMQLNYSRSREFTWNMMIGGLDFAKKRMYFTTGLGLNYAGYHFKNNINISTSNDTTAFSAFTEPSYNKYKLRATYLQMPVLFGVRIGNVKKDYGLQFGVIGGMKIGSIVKEKYNFDGKNVKNKVKDDFNLNPFKAMATVRLRFNYFAVYANYSLTSLFENNKAPELYPFSVGLNFGI